MTPIPGFTPHRKRHSARILLERTTASAVAAEATRRGITVAEVLRETVMLRFPVPNSQE